MRLFTLLFLLPLLFCFGSCAKKEHAVTLPARNNNVHDEVEMGGDYAKQIYYNLSDSAAVATSDHTKWDVSFEAGAGHNHMFINGSIGIELMTTADTSFAATCSLPAGISSDSWHYEASSGVPDSSAAGNWQQATHEGSNLFILRIGTIPPFQYRKLRIVSVDDKAYTIEYGNLAETQCHIAILPKDETRNFIHFTFANGVMAPEPPKADWDILFTRYQTAIMDDTVGHVVPYTVNGVLLNPYQTTAACITTTNFDGITAATADSLTFTGYQDVIGYDWKTYNNGTYIVNTARCFLIRTQRGQLWKLHFVGWYNNAGVGGSPSFEFQRLD